MAKMIRADSKQTKSRLTTAPGTLHFMPPETFDEIDPVYGTPVDVFSFAGIALHLFSEEWPTPASQVKKDPKTKMLVALTEAQRRQAYLDKMTGGAAVLRPLIERCLENEPEDRPLIEEVADVIEPLKTTKLEVQKLAGQLKGARVTTPDMTRPGSLAEEYSLHERRIISKINKKNCKDLSEQETMAALQDKTKALMLSVNCEEDNDDDEVEHSSHPLRYGSEEKGEKAYRPLDNKPPSYEYDQYQRCQTHHQNYNVPAQQRPAFQGDWQPYHGNAKHNCYDDYQGSHQHQNYFYPPPRSLQRNYGPPTYYSQPRNAPPGNHVPPEDYGQLEGYAPLRVYTPPRGYAPTQGYAKQQNYSPYQYFEIQHERDYQQQYYRQPQRIGLSNYSRAAEENADGEKYSVIITGVAGFGKSTFCNYLMQEEVFKSNSGATCVTSKSDGHICNILGTKVLFVDTPGFSGEYNSNEQCMTDLSLAFLLARNGVSAIILCFNGANRFDSAFGDTIRELRLLGDNWWSYAFVVFTHADDFGDTAEEQRSMVLSWLRDQRCPDDLKLLFQCVENRFITIESKKKKK